MILLLPSLKLGLLLCTPSLVSVVLGLRLWTPSLACVVLDYSYGHWAWFVWCWDYSYGHWAWLLWCWGYGYVHRAWLLWCYQNQTSSVSQALFQLNCTHPCPCLLFKASRLWHRGFQTVVRETSGIPSEARDQKLLTQQISENSFSVFGAVFLISKFYFWISFRNDFKTLPRLPHMASRGHPKNSICNRMAHSPFHSRKACSRWECQSGFWIKVR